MSRSPNPVPAPATLGDRLALARRARFVGRTAELARWQRMLDGEAEPVWFLHGPGGIGKTTLLAELARRAEAAGRIVVEIDARHLTASPASWHQALRLALSVEQPEPLPPPGSVLLVDTFETIAGLEGWLRDEELPRYAADVQVVLAGRTPADPAWRLDPGWSSVAAVTRLSPWSEAEAQDYLASRLGGQTVPAGMVERGAGVPLLLALLADAHRRGADLPAPDRAEPALHETLVRELLERFARELSDPVLRAALDVLTVARSVTVPMLADTVDATAAADTYDWLAGLPFVLAGEAGLQMHDLVREAFAATWRARDPVAIDRAGLKVQQYLARRAPLVGRDEAIRQLKDWIFVLRFTDVGHITDHRHIEAYRLGGLERDGDAVVALWRDEAEPLATLALRAAQCALQVQAQLEEYVVGGDQPLVLRLGLGAGQASAFQLGGVDGQWEFCVVGEALEQAGRAERLAPPGGVAASPEAWQLLCPAVSGALLTPGAADGGARLERVLAPPPVKRVRPVAVRPEAEAILRGLVPQPVQARLGLGQVEWLAELRTVTAIFICLRRLDHRLPLEQAQAALESVQREVRRYEGTLNKLAVDDKGTVLIGLFGAPPFAHEDDPERALRCALELQARAAGLGLQLAIGVTFGHVFAGPVGSATRREYTAMGDTVNLAARLMALAGRWHGSVLRFRHLSQRPPPLEL